MSGAAALVVQARAGHVQDLSCRVRAGHRRPSFRLRRGQADAFSWLVKVFQVLAGEG
jgi:hypothetical protein